MSENKNNTKAGTEKEVQIIMDAKGIPVWNSEKDGLVKGLSKADFIKNPKIKEGDKREALSEYWKWWTAGKVEKLAFFKQKVIDTEEAIEQGKMNAEMALRELTEMEKHEAKLAKFEKMMARERAAIAKLKGEDTGEA